MRHVKLMLVLAAGLTLATMGRAWASPCTGSGIFASASSNGTDTFPGTNVGTVGSASGDICQIGNLSEYNGGSGGAFVNGSNNPSNYEFYYAGGTLDIEEEIGNNGTAKNGLDVELDGLASESSTSSSGTLASIFIPYSSGPSGFYTVTDQNLGAGWYTLSTYLAGDDIGDPNYQADFTSTATVPEPSSLAVFAAGLLALAAAAALRRQRGN